MEDIVKLKLTKASVLESIREHLKCAKPTYSLIQRSGQSAYVLLPCSVEEHTLYVKVTLPHAACEQQESLIIISAHIPERPYQGEK
jgi:hypothetical protein